MVLLSTLTSIRCLTKSQPGFTSKRFCLTNLLEICDDVTGILDEGNPVDVVYLDFQKAFDKVPYKRLGCKLASHGIDSNVREWIQKWLSRREQRVVINGAESKWVGVPSGVPQGSVLGPVLFLIYINDIDYAVDTTMKKFADDTKLYERVRTEEQVISMQNSLDSVLKWGNDWQMLFNLSKCKILHVGKKY